MVAGLAPERVKPVLEVAMAMQVPDLRWFRDSMIAATAQEHSLTLMTLNVSDLAGLRL